jgi:hypothetical protein
MLSDDVYRSKLASAFAGIRRAADALSSVAEVEASEGPARLRLALNPRTPGACPLELMVRADQRYDIQIGTEFYEDCPVESIEDFEALISAVAAGDVVTRHYFSAATGQLRVVETVVRLPGPRLWKRGYTIGQPGKTASAQADPSADGSVVKDRNFLPYKR